MNDEMQAQQPLSRQQFAGLRRGDTIRDRRGRGRVWTVNGDAYEQGGEFLVVLRSRDLVRVERQRFADDYTLAESAELRLPPLAR